jgi:hypothetical protein
MKTAARRKNNLEASQRMANPPRAAGSAGLPFALNYITMTGKGGMKKG